MASLGKALVTILFAVMIIWLSVLNRESVDFSLAPFVDGLSLPLPIIIFVATLLGFIWGGIMAWLNGGKIRSEVSRLRREIKHIEKEQHDKKDIVL